MMDLSILLEASKQIQHAFGLTLKIATEMRLAFFSLQLPPSFMSFSLYATTRKHLGPTHGSVATRPKAVAEESIKFDRFTKFSFIVCRGGAGAALRRHAIIHFSLSIEGCCLPTSKSNLAFPSI